MTLPLPKSLRTTRSLPSTTLRNFARNRSRETSDASSRRREISGFSSGIRQNSLASALAQVNRILPIIGFALVSLALPCTAQTARQLSQPATYAPPVHIPPSFQRSTGPLSIRLSDATFANEQRSSVQRTRTVTHASHAATRQSVGIQDRIEPAFQRNVRQTAAQEPVRYQAPPRHDFQPPVAPRQLQQPMRTARTEARQGNRSRSGRTIARPVSILNTPAGQGDEGLDEDEEEEGLQSRLDELMAETENELRRRGTDDESDSDKPKKDRTKSLLDNLDDTDSDEPAASKSSLLDKSCEDFRSQLLDNPIRNISLDISPPRAGELGEMSIYDGMTRSWIDRGGNVIATGTMVDFRRSYIILDSGQRIPFARLSDADLAAVGEHWGMPAICSVGNRGYVPRNWIPQTYTWTASSLCHKPLYFENIQLERYGHSHGPFMQPVRSVGHFFVSLAFLPYQTAIHPANECQYALGFYRPGDCAPWLRNPLPISLRGAGRQALVTAGLSVIQ